tara:strand:+ start:4839 stop:5042 length:204 start_codon:yes stop_codon:yes gene_type:complete
MKNMTACILTAITLAGCVTCKDPDGKEKAPEADYYQPGFLYEVDEDGNPVKEESEPETDEKTESPEQ